MDPCLVFCMTNTEKSAKNYRRNLETWSHICYLSSRWTTVSEKSLVPAHFVLINISGRVDSLDSETVFEKGHPRNIFVKLFQNLNSSLREECLRITSCPFSANSPEPSEACFLTDQNFANNIWKGSPKENLNEIVSKSDRPYQKWGIFKNFIMSG